MTKEETRHLRLRRKADESVVLRPDGGIHPPVCERLRAARQERGLDLFRVERDTKIRVRFLEAIEEGRYDDLPGEIYARGFLRNYAAYLGLDPDDIETRWRAEKGATPPPPTPELIHPTARSYIPQPMPEMPKTPAPAAPVPGAASGAAAEAAPPGERVIKIHLRVPQLHPPAVHLPAPKVHRPEVHLPEVALPPAREKARAWLAARKARAAQAAEAAASEVAAGTEAAAAAAPAETVVSAVSAGDASSVESAGTASVAEISPNVAATASAGAAGEAAAAPAIQKPARRRTRKVPEAESKASPSIVGPAPLEVPKRGLLLEPGHLVLAAMGIVALLVASFFGLQVTRILDNPTVQVTSPDQAIVTLPAGTAQFELAGTATPGSVVQIAWDERDPNVVETKDGRWSFTTPLHDGMNQFKVTARNNLTNHNSDPVHLILNVQTPTASPLPQLLVVETPTDKQTFQTRDVPVKGTTVGITSVTITPTYLGPAPRITPRPSSTASRAPTAVPTIAPTQSATPFVAPTATPTPRPTPTPNPSASAGPSPVSVIPTIDGKFSTSIRLAPGMWKLTVVGSDSNGKTAPPVTITVIIVSPQLSVTIEIHGGKTYLKIWKDGVVLPGYSKDMPNDFKVTILAYESVWIHTGSGSRTYITVNGVSYGPLGNSKTGSWRITAFGPPTPSNDL